MPSELKSFGEMLGQNLIELPHVSCRANSPVVKQFITIVRRCDVLISGVNSSLSCSCSRGFALEINVLGQLRERRSRDQQDCSVSVDLNALFY